MVKLQRCCYQASGLLLAWLAQKGTTVPHIWQPPQTTQLATVLRLKLEYTLSTAAAYTVPSHAPAAAYTNPYIGHAAAYTAPVLAPYAASYTVAGARLGGVPAAIPGAALH